MELKSHKCNLLVEQCITNELIILLSSSYLQTPFFRISSLGDLFAMTLINDLKVVKSGTNFCPEQTIRFGNIFVWNKIQK